MEDNVVKSERMSVSLIHNQADYLMKVIACNYLMKSNEIIVAT